VDFPLRPMLPNLFANYGTFLELLRRNAFLRPDGCDSGRRPLRRRSWARIPDSASVPSPSAPFSKAHRRLLPPKKYRSSVPRSFFPPARLALIATLFFTKAGDTRLPGTDRLANLISSLTQTYRRRRTALLFPHKEVKLSSHPQLRQTRDKASIRSQFPPLIKSGSAKTSPSNTPCRMAQATSLSFPPLVVCFYFPVYLTLETPDLIHSLMTRKIKLASPVYGASARNSFRRIWSSAGSTPLCTFPPLYEDNTSRKR